MLAPDERPERRLAGPLAAQAQQGVLFPALLRDPLRALIALLALPPLSVELGLVAQQFRVILPRLRYLTYSVLFLAVAALPLKVLKAGALHG